MSLNPSDPALAVWQDLLRFQRRATMRLDTDLQDHRGVTLDEYDVLFQLSAAALIARSSCTRVVDRLADRGWVRREPNEQDRRSVEVTLTPEGKGALRRAAVIHLKGLDELFVSKLERTDLRDLERILGRLRGVKG